jgi:regulator of ribonuclease activity A
VTTSFKTANLCDRHGEHVQIAQSVFRQFGARATFSGQIATLQVFEDNGLVHDAIAAPGFHRVLVIDGGASLRRALIGEVLAVHATKHHWDGIIVNGAVRDIDRLADLDIGVLALAHTPAGAARRGQGTHALPVAFAGVVFRPGEWLYADTDGIVIGSERLI